MCSHGTDWVLPFVLGKEGGNGKVKPCLLSQGLKSLHSLPSARGIDCTHAAQMRDTLREKQPILFPQSITFLTLPEFMQFVKPKPNYWLCWNMRIEWMARVSLDNCCYVFQVSSKWGIPSESLTKLEYVLFVNSSASSLCHWHITLISPFIFASTHPVKISDSFHKCTLRFLIKKLCNSPREKGFCK